MPALKGKNILIYQQRGWSLRIGHFLAKQLAAEGCKLAAITFKGGANRFVKKQKDVRYELIINNDEITADPIGYLGKNNLTLRDVCEGIGVDSIWHIAQTLRIYSKSYGEKYYYSFRQNVTDEVMVAYIKAIYVYTERIFKEFKPDIILTPNYTGPQHLIMNLYAKKHGVPMLAIVDTKIQGVSVMTDSYLFDSGTYYDRVIALRKGEVNSKNIERAKQYINEFRKEFKVPNYAKEEKAKTTMQKIRAELAPWRQIYRWFTNKPDSLGVAGITKDYRPPKIILRDHFLSKRYSAYMNKFSYVPFETINKFVYFPLQVQPEEAIDVMAPRFSNQIETARLVAMALPDDYTLVVKDHPAMLGKRNPSYMEKLARTLNVQLVDYRIPTKEVLAKCSMVISPNSTTLAEAAFYKKPAIQLGDLGTTQLLPNVIRHTDMTTLSGVIKKHLQFKTSSKEYERYLEQYVAAAFDVGLEEDYLSLWTRGSKINMEKLWQFYKKEILSHV